MIIKQESENPIEDYFYGQHLFNALELVKQTSTSNVVDTDILKEACDTSIVMLKNYIKYIEKLEQSMVKLNSKEKVQEMIKKGFDD